MLAREFDAAYGAIKVGCRSACSGRVAMGPAGRSVPATWQGQLGDGGCSCWLLQAPAAE